MSAYSAAERLLHRLALGRPWMLRAALEIDRQSGAEAPPAPVFVCGLARSGTTAVMRLLHASGAFVSLSYRHMPFVTAPRLWPAVSARFWRGVARRERPHADGIEVDADSPEAFEEVFWRAVLGDRQFADPRVILPVAPDAEAIAEFRAFVARLVATAGRPGMRYLSKNNPNLLRLDALRVAFPDARILVVLRDPAAFARSTMTQHRRFREIHATDPFARRYMAWLGHFEFGQDFRPLGFPGVEPPADPARDLDEAWLAGYWAAAHRGFAERLPDGVALVSQADLVAEPARSVAAIAAHAGLAETSLDAGAIRQACPEIGPSGNAEADALYRELRARALNAPRRSPRAEMESSRPGR